MHQSSFPILEAKELLAVLEGFERLAGIGNLVEGVGKFVEGAERLGEVLVGDEKFEGNVDRHKWNVC